MTAYTPRGYPYPDDYQAPADVPAALDALATAVNADVDAVDGQVGANATEIAALKARQVIAGNGLTGGGNLAASRTLNVVAGTGITVLADSVGLNTGYTDGRYQLKDGNTAKIAAEGTVNVGDKSMGVLVWTVGDLAAGEEKETTVQVAKGSYVFVSVQHHSTYIFAVANLVTGSTTDSCTLRVRNSTLQTNHTNVKIHLLVVNP